MIGLKEIIKELNIPNNMRVHMSKKQTTLLNISIPQKINELKPKGLWYGFGNSWLDWIRSDMPEWEGDHIYHVIFPETKNLLKIKSVPEIMQFTKEYLDTNNEINKIYGSHNNMNAMFIDWPRVYKKYDGIEIYPYIHRVRYELICTMGGTWHRDVYGIFQT